MNKKSNQRIKLGEKLMKAIVCTKYGSPDVFQLIEVEKPKPRKNEVLIKIYATAVHSGDCRMRSLNLDDISFFQRIMARMVLGVTKPRNPILGLWLAGEVETAGIKVTKFKKGDQVYARTLDMRFGAYAEYICLPENSLMVLKPTNLSYEEAMAIPFGGLSALHFLRKSDIQRGQKVFIYGASGAVGTSALQLAKYYGAEVTAVCSTGNLEWVKSLGADAVIDYTKEDFSMCNGLFDLVFDAVGKISNSISQKALKPDGKYVSILTSGHARMELEDLVFLTKLVETGKLKPVIDRCYPLEQMAEAHRYVDQGHKKGNVVITIAH
jgi:NADPH:quinone reductase-like Zn-dependent oxidoreductase